ncbi:hypothetical protein [Polyangium aurulentum]|uniref:hypothetical protein n=1 Tax=Polyangium aurulentum TaxID=2567896 RepID=UPI0010AE4291|nr:hypothetical protein [Polyangium aurulentum]UQA57309.1 hypothetical protein E8A73_039430 [Polyangium aurulentum]
MRDRGKTWLIALGTLTLVAGCPSPEAKRSRGGGAGADPGNHDRDGSVELHGERTDPYYRTPQVHSPR